MLYEIVLVIGKATN